MGTHTDEELEEAAGRECDGAGTDLISGSRDMSWTFRSLPAATRAFQRLSKKRRLIELKLEKEL